MMPAPRKATARTFARLLTLAGAVALLLPQPAAGANGGACSSDKDVSAAATTARMMAWLVSNDDEQMALAPRNVLQLRMNVNVSVFEGQGRGLAAAVPVKRGELFSWVPKKYALNLETSALPPALKAALIESTNDPSKLLEILELAAVLIFEAGLGNSSWFEPYVSALPKLPPRNAATWRADGEYTSSSHHNFMPRDVSERSCVVTEKQLYVAFTGMRGSNCANVLPDLLQSLAPHLDADLDDRAKDAKGGVSRIPHKQLQDISERWSQGRQNTQLVKQTQWACSLATSRNMGGSLYPMVDMANHNPAAVWGTDTVGFDFNPDCVPTMLNCLPEWTGEGLQRSARGVITPDTCAGSVRTSCTARDLSSANSGRGTVALRDYAAGEQVYDFYGKQSNLHLLAQWGVTVDDNMIGSEALFDWSTVKYLWEENVHRQWEWMARSPVLAGCTAIFDALSMSERPKMAPQYFRLALNLTAFPHV